MWQETQQEEELAEVHACILSDKWRQTGDLAPSLVVTHRQGLPRPSAGFARPSNGTHLASSLLPIATVSLGGRSKGRRDR